MEKYPDEILNDLKIDFEQDACQKLKVVDVATLLQHGFKPKAQILSPWLTSQSLSMIYAPRGVGKTHVSLGIAYAVASGDTFLKWHAPISKGVLFIDGEMPGAALQERVNKIIASSDKKVSAPLLFVTPDLQEYNIPDLGTVEGQNAIDQHITDEIELIIIDNLSSLVRSGRENEAESWLPIQEWALRLRAKGKSVLFIHHSGKSGSQRGTSRREDVLDTVINLKHPSDYSAEQGATFEVSFVKSRHLLGEDIKPFLAQLGTNELNNQSWLVQTLEESNYEKVIKLKNDGYEPKEICQELELHKSTVSRYLKKAREMGLLSDDE